MFPLKFSFSFLMPKIDLSIETDFPLSDLSVLFFSFYLPIPIHSHSLLDLFIIDSWNWWKLLFEHKLLLLLFQRPSHVLLILFVRFTALFLVFGIMEGILSLDLLGFFEGGLLAVWGEVWAVWEGGRGFSLVLGVLFDVILRHGLGLYFL